MDLLSLIIVGIAAIAGGLAVGYYLRLVISLGKRGSMEIEIKRMRLAAEEEAKNITDEAAKKAEKIISDAEREAKEARTELKKTEDRLIKREDLLDSRQSDIDKQIEDVKKRVEEIKAIRQNAETLEIKRKTELERVAGLSSEEARDELFRKTETDYEEDLVVRMQKLEYSNEEKLEKRAQEILTTVVQRYANAQNNEYLSTSITIPSEDIKGKIIGKEGRNIRAFEQAAGVDVIVDDTPGTITISSFDPVRRQIARVALENLIMDGRIQPAKIEDFIEKAKEEISKIIKTKGEQAAYECGVMNLDSRILTILGRLHFRTSYGQNVLQHSIEMAHIAGMLAEELGADVRIAKAGALLHDIGKAVDHEIQGTHVEIGRRILQKFGADEHIIKAMQSHHEEYPYETPEAVIVQTADAISGGRPGARRDSVEQYLKRLEDLEKTAASFRGVERAFALQAGREIRIFVSPEQINDFETRELARDIAHRIESDLNYPGEIKVHVIRETRVIEYAR
jgi:ribonuclease Y